MEDVCEHLVNWFKSLEPRYRIPLGLSLRLAALLMVNDNYSSRPVARLAPLLTVKG